MRSLGLASIKNQLFHSLDRFFFHSDGKQQLIRFRFFLGLILFGLYSFRSFDLFMLYGEDGVIPRQVLGIIFSENLRFSILNYFNPDWFLVFCHGFHLLLLLFFAFGKTGRVLNTILFFLHISFINRNFPASYGVDFVTTYYMFYFILVDFRKNSEMDQTLHSVAWRLMQIHLCVVYMYSGLDKVRGDQWWNGEALWQVMGNYQLTGFDLSFISNFPTLFGMMSLLTLAWEVYFCAMIWNSKWKWLAMLLGVMIHGGIAFLLRLPFFSTMMISSYILFINPKTEIDVLPKFLRTKLNA